jgi:hypothetical protein
MDPCWLVPVTKCVCSASQGPTQRVWHLQALGRVSLNWLLDKTDHYRIIIRRCSFNVSYGVRISVYALRNVSQQLYIDKVELVKEIIVNLARDIEDVQRGNQCRGVWQDISVESFLRKGQTVKLVGGIYDLGETKG